MGFQNFDAGSVNLPGFSRFLQERSPQREIRDELDLSLQLLFSFKASDSQLAAWAPWRVRSRYDATASRVGGSINSGPTGSSIAASRMRSISAFASASSVQPSISSTGSS